MLAPVLVSRVPVSMSENSAPVPKATGLAPVLVQVLLHLGA